MSQAPAEAVEPDEDESGPLVPEPPRRVPFAVAVTAALLGLLSLSLAIGALLTLSANGYYDDGIGEATAEGLGTGLLAVAAAVVAAVAWSFVRNGNTVGPMVVGVLTVLTGLVFLVGGVLGESPDTDGVRAGMLALTVGLGVLLVPLLGHGPGYLAARRVWARAEAAWLQDMTTPDLPQMPAGQQWPAQQWGAPPPGNPGQYQHPPQPWPGQQLPPQPWPGQQPPSQPWPGQQPPSPPWPGQQPPSYQAWPPQAFPIPPGPGGRPPTIPDPFSAPPAPPAAGPPAPADAPPAAVESVAQQVPAPVESVAQQAPTEQIRTTEQPPSTIP